MVMYQSTLPMTQSELAAALGVNPSIVSRLRQRGMPTHSLEAAQAWRRRNVAPYHKSHSSPGVRPVLAAGANGTELATVDELERLLRKSALMTGEAALQVVRALADSAADLLAAGRPLGAIEPALRVAMASVPHDLRDRTQVQIEVLGVLCADVVKAMEASFSTAAEREADRETFRAGGDAMAAEMGRFWYSVAAGEVRAT
jgi:hypothetical protein